MMDAVLFYSHARRESVVQRHTALSTRAFVAVNSMDTKKLAEVRSQLTRDGKIESGVEKGAALHLLYFGKLVKSKRILDLLDAFTLLRAKHSNVTLTVIGGGELESMVRERAESEGFRYLGEIHDVEATAPILEAMDVLVLPGAVGLALVHAYAFGLPVITYASTETGPFHGPELEYLRHGENGLLSNPGPEALSNTIAMLIEDRELLLAMKANALDTEESEANIERMVDGFRQAIAYVTAGKA
ncbi:glycosyltransferase family 4 protein [bacterium]|nr:glycosyltransferase family 4 protein [bacterium]